jgi:hypothetical protein
MQRYKKNRFGALKKTILSGGMGNNPKVSISAFIDFFTTQLE